MRPSYVRFIPNAHDLQLCAAPVCLRNEKTTAAKIYDVKASPSAPPVRHACPNPHDLKLDGFRVIFL